MELDEVAQAVPTDMCSFTLGCMMGKIPSAHFLDDLELNTSFCYASPVMREQRLQGLIRQIEAGGLSKNKHFEAYQEPLVREAKQRQVRLRAIREILLQAEHESWNVTLEQQADDAWRLHCQSARWNVSWSAILQAFELALLRETPAVSRVIDGKTSPETSLSTV